MRIPRKIKKRLRAEAERFTCAACGGTFRKSWSDEEAAAESANAWGQLPREDLAVICDDCFRGP